MGQHGASISPITFLNAQAASAASSWYRVDFAYNGGDQRSIMGTRTDVDSAVAVEVKTSISATLSVIATATVYTSANGTNNSAVIQGAFTHIRIRKIGASGAATFVGVV